MLFCTRYRMTFRVVLTVVCNALGKLAPGMITGLVLTGTLQQKKRWSTDLPGRGTLPWHYPNNSITGLPVVMGREMPLLFCGSFNGMSSAW